MLRYNEITGEFYEVEDDISFTPQVESPIVSQANKEQGVFSSICGYAIQGITFFVVSWFCVISFCLIIGLNITLFVRLILSGVLAFAISIIMRISSKHIDCLSQNHS